MGKSSELIILYPKNHGIPLLLKFICQIGQSLALKDATFIPANEKFHPQPELKVTSRAGVSLQGVSAIAKCLARLEPSLYAHFDAYDSCIIDHWLDSLLSSHEESTLELFARADKHLRNLTSFVGESYSVADFAFWIRVNNYTNSHLDFDLVAYPNLCRWYYSCCNHETFGILKALAAVTDMPATIGIRSLAGPSTS